MKTISFQSDRFTVRFTLNLRSITARCDCWRGSNGQLCWHVANIAAGSSCGAAEKANQEELHRHLSDQVRDLGVCYLAASRELTTAKHNMEEAGDPLAQWLGLSFSHSEPEAEVAHQTVLDVSGYQQHAFQQPRSGGILAGFARAMRRLFGLLAMIFIALVVLSLLAATCSRN